VLDLHSCQARLEDFAQMRGPNKVSGAGCLCCQSLLITKRNNFVLKNIVISSQIDTLKGCQLAGWLDQADNIAISASSQSLSWN